jgi:CBS domain-containing membrane protein
VIARLPRPVHCGLACTVAMLAIGGLSLLSTSPLLFPAIGASAFLVFSYPQSALASPRNVVLGHGLGVLFGALAAELLGVVAHSPWLAQDGAWRAVVAAALALGATTWSMVGLHLDHPPAGATTLIVATGLMGGWRDLAAILGAALALWLLGSLFHRATGTVYPRWAPRVAG